MSYEHFLNGHNPETDGLANMALQDVRSSGLSSDILERAQVRIFSGSNDTLKKRLGFASMNGQHLLRTHRLVEFPYLDAKGSPVRYEYKPFPSLHTANEAKPRKYLQSKGVPATPYILPDVWAVKDKTNKALWITEGVKKVLALVQHGRLAIGLSGVFNFRASKEGEQESTYLWRELHSFSWSGRTVFIAFDCDLWVNPMVRQALYELSFKLFGLGASPHFPVWYGHKGIDDYLVAQASATSALSELERTAKNMEDFIAFDHRVEVLSALGRSDGLPQLAEKQLTHLVAKKLGLRAQDVNSDVRRRRNGEQTHSDDASLHPFFVNDRGGVCRWRRERDGSETAFELSNFIARVTEDVSVDNGLEIRRRFVIEGGNSHGPFPRISLPTTQFASLNWVTQHWGNDAIIRAGQTNRDQLREFIQNYSFNVGVTRRTVYGHTGWKCIDGTWCYLMANGALGIDGVEVNLPDEFQEVGRYCLPATPENEGEAITVALESFLAIGDPSLTIPALAFVFLSPLTTVLDPMPSFSLYAYGEKDTFKTTVAILMLAFFGKLTKEALANFDSTSNSIMQRASILKDTIMVVDDYYPSPRQKEAMQKESIAQRIIRDVGNRTGRSRLNPDSTARPVPVPKGMILITGEELPGLQSTLSRLITIEFSRGSVIREKLKKAQDTASLYPHAMTSYILWIRDRLALIQQSFREEFDRLRDRAASESQSRKIPEHVAYLYFAWKTMCQWAMEKGAKDLSLDTGWDALMAAAEKQAQRVEEDDPVKTFFEVIEALLTQGKLRMEHRSADSREIIGGLSGELIGYFDEDCYYLLPTPLWHQVTTYLHFEGGHFPVTKNTLYQLLDKRGHLLTQNGKSLYNVRIGGKVHAFLRLKRGDLLVSGGEGKDDDA